MQLMAPAPIPPPNISFLAPGSDLFKTWLRFRSGAEVGAVAQHWLAVSARTLGSYDAIRQVRSAMQAKNDHCRSMRLQVENAEQKTANLNDRLASLEEAKRRCERELADARKAANES